MKINCPGCFVLCFSKMDTIVRFNEQANMMKMSCYRFFHHPPVLFSVFLQRRLFLDSTSGHTLSDISNSSCSVVLAPRPLQHFVCGFIEQYLNTLPHPEHSTNVLARAETSMFFFFLHPSSVLYLCTISSRISS